MNAPSTLPAIELVRQTLHEQLGLDPASLAPETELAAVGVDSLTLAELLFSLEDRLGTTMADVATLPRSIGDLVALVESHLTQLAAAAAS